MLGRELDAAAEVTLATADTLHGPDLAFLRRERAFRGLRVFVTQMVRDILQAIQPAALPDLSYLVDPFFDKARSLPLGYALALPWAQRLGSAAGGRPAYRPRPGFWPLPSSQRVTGQQSEARAGCCSAG